MTKADGRPPTVVDLFCGAGGFSLGFQAAGCRIIAGIDHDEVAASTYRYNFTRFQPDNPPVVFGGKEGELDRNAEAAIMAIERPDILVGSPPCQAFSRIGRAKIASISGRGVASDPRNSLYRRFLSIVEQSSPLAVVMENVPGMLTMGGVNVAHVVGEELTDHGYNVGFAVLNAAWYGVPQFRERVIFIGVREDLGIQPRMPVATHQADLPSGYIRPEKNGTLPLFPHWFEGLPVKLNSDNPPAVTVSEALDDLPVITRHLDPHDQPPRGEFRRPEPYRYKPHSSFATLMRQWPGLPESDHVVDHEIRRTPRDYATFARMKHGHRYPDAHRIAKKLFRKELATRRSEGMTLERGTDEYMELRAKYVPPYDPDKFKDKWRKLDPNKPSRTVPAHLSRDSYSHIHHDSQQARAISIREAARLQSFPDSFEFLGNMGDCFRQIGNAVPPLMAWAIAAELLTLLGTPSTEIPLPGPSEEKAGVPGK